MLRTHAAWLAVTALIGSFFVATAPTAAAAPAVTSVLMERQSGSTGLFRQPGLGGATLNATPRGSATSGDVTVPIIEFNSVVGSDMSTFVTVDVSADLAPGTYQTSRLAGGAEALLGVTGPGIDGCVTDELGTLTVIDAHYDADGRPTVYAARFDMPACSQYPAAHGEVRWNSSEPIGVLQAPDVTQIEQPVVVNSTADLSVTMTAVGNAPTEAGAATVRQTPLWDGSMYWSIAADGCVGRTLQPGDTCTVTMRFTPKRPNGTPTGHIYAWVDVPDGQATAASAPILAQVVALGGQPIGLHVDGAFRHHVLTWGNPQAGWNPLAITTYRIYRVMPDGTRRLLGWTSQSFFVVSPLPDRYGATYVVTASQGGAPEGPLSVPASGTTASRELLYAVDESGLVNQQLAPDAAAPVQFAGGTVGGSSVRGWDLGDVHDLTVSRNQAVVAWDVQSRTFAPGQAGITTSASDGRGYGYTSWAVNKGVTGTQAWDVDPALSADGARVVYTHADAPGDPTVLRIAPTTVGAAAVDVPGSSGLSDATFTADGKALIAVKVTNGVSSLVRLDPVHGTVTDLAGTDGLGEPDVAADGRIVTVRGTDPAHPQASELVLISAGGATVDPVTGVPAGANWSPAFSYDGTAIRFTHRDDVSGSAGRSWGNGYSVDLATGASVNLTNIPDGGAQTPLVLEEDGAHRIDQTAPVARVTAPTQPTVLASTLTASWAATDPAITGAAASGVWTYDARWRTATPSHDFGAYVYPAGWQKTTNTHGTIAVIPGSEYCISVRARDLAGNVSAWTADRCTTSPLDDRALTTSAHRGASGHYYRGTYSRAAKPAVRYLRTSVTARRIGIVLTTCRTCGRLDVWLDGRYLGRISSYARTTHYRETIWLAAIPRRSGTLSIRTVNQYQVLLDGVITTR